jgi:hypothetical protein
LKTENHQNNIWNPVPTEEIMQGTAIRRTKSCSSDTQTLLTVRSTQKHINAFYKQNAKTSHVKACGTYIQLRFEDFKQGKMNILYEKFG